jgi:hypothetical protein
MTQKVFAIGNSVAVTVPSRLRILPGTRLRYVSTKKNRLAYDVIEEPAKKAEKRAYLKKVTGNLKLDMTTEQFMRIKAYCREHPYEKL